METDQQTTGELAAVSSTPWLDSPQWQCTECGRVGTVGRCCGLNTRRPLNALARQEQDAELKREESNVKAEARESASVASSALMGADNGGKK
jgi:hypothetical protein